MGNLNFSRGFGEHRYKDAKNLSQEEQALSAKPEILKTSFEKLDFILIGCDSISEKLLNT